MDRQAGGEHREEMDRRGGAAGTAHLQKISVMRSGDHQRCQDFFQPVDRCSMKRWTGKLEANIVKRWTGEVALLEQPISKNKRISVAKIFQQIDCCSVEGSVYASVSAERFQMAEIPGLRHAGEFMRSDLGKNRQEFPTDR
jgi:hypothetical protein